MFLAKTEGHPDTLLNCSAVTRSLQSYCVISQGGTEIAYSFILLLKYDASLCCTFEFNASIGMRHVTLGTALPHRQPTWPLQLGGMGCVVTLILDTSSVPWGGRCPGQCGCIMTWVSYPMLLGEQRTSS